MKRSEQEIPSEKQQKRHPGIRIGSKGSEEWLVLTESTTDQTGDYIHGCGVYIEGMEVLASVHNGPIALSGDGRVERVIVPFCPQCENEPKPFGSITNGVLIVR